MRFAWLALVCGCTFHKLPPASFDVSQTPASADERASFAVHLTARDAHGARLDTYDGAPALSADWGEVIVKTAPKFRAGEADATVQLTRETNSVNLAAHLIATDGSARGVSAAIAVTAPAWNVDNTVTVLAPDPTSWDQNSVFFPSWLRKGGVYDAFYLGYGNTAVGWGLATSASGIDFMHRAAPLFGASTSGWDQGELPAIFLPRFDGARWVAVYVAAPASGRAIGFAESPDGIAWTRHAQPILATPTADCAELAPQAFLVEGGAYHVYLGEVNGPCVATSTDGGRSFGAPVKLSGFPTGMYLSVRGVEKDGAVWRMWFSEDGSNTRYATSADGASWQLSASAPLPLLAHTILWNEVDETYEALITVVDGYGRARRP
jgi:hypothetical protein